MAAAGWLSRHIAEVPPGELWLGEREREILAALRFAPRRDSWRLGRFTAKAAIAAWSGIPAAVVEVLPADDGAPEAWAGAERIAVSLSLSHRAGLAIAAVYDLPGEIGCDLELVEPRSDAFIREWMAPAERRVLASVDHARRATVANLLWTGKEAVAKVRRAGLRLDVRALHVSAVGAENGPGDGAWRPVTVVRGGEDGERVAPTAGWWREAGGYVMTVAGEPAPERLIALDPVA